MELVSSRRLLYATKKHRRDVFIEFIRAEMQRCFALYDKSEIYQRYIVCMTEISDLISAHRANPEKSRLRVVVPSIGMFHTELDLVGAFRFYDQKSCLSRRSFVAPSFNEIRHMLNVAQAQAICRGGIRMVSFDGDQTLYADGGCISDERIITQIVELLQDGVIVAIVTAASYGDHGPGYERRIELLLAEFKEQKLPPEILGNFYVVGGECNYLFQCSAKATLEYIPRDTWQREIFYFDEDEIKRVLDAAEKTLRQCITELGMTDDVRLIRKERAVGIIPSTPGLRLKREALDETAYTLSSVLNKSNVRMPFCAFNGGNDVFVDVGDKGVGIRGLQARAGIKPVQCLHVGDQFLTQGNDYACRSTAATIWITSPDETAYILKLLHRTIQDNRQVSTREGPLGEAHTEE